jgi:hypothetical protein
VTRLLLATVVAAGLTLGVGAQTQTPPARPLPDRAVLFKATQDNLARAQRDQGRYAYKERRTELHTNPFGKIGTEGTRVYDVTPGPESGVVFRTLLEKDGVKVNDAKPQRQDLREPSTRTSAMEEIVNTMEFVMQRRETLEGRDTIVVTFAPRPGTRPQTREGKLANQFTGLIWVDEAEQEVVRVEGTATGSISYGLGMIARLNKGSQVVLRREPVEGGIWLPTSVRFVGAGRAMVFRKLDIDFAVDWFDYRPQKR